MGTKGKTVTPGVFKKMAGRAETKTGPLKKMKPAAYRYKK